MRPIPEPYRTLLEPLGLLEELDEREAIVSGGVGPERWRVAYEIVCDSHGIEPKARQEQLFAV